MNRFVLPFFALLSIFLATPVRAELLITELQAANKSTLVDEDGQTSDWIEIYNTGPDSVNLGGYYLTDRATNPTRWTFPTTALGPGEFLVVFASGKDRKSGELHTNFSLSAAGEYLGLIAPDGTTVVHEFAPAFSALQDDQTYGLPFSGLTLIDEGADVQWLVPTSGSLGSTWTSDSYTPGASWSSGETGLGFGSVAGTNFDGLEAYYDFEDGAGTGLTDRSGNGHDGTLTNMNIENDWVASKSGLGLALDFDGADDSVILDAAADFGLLGNFTVSAWVRLDNVTGDNTILGQNANGLHLTTRNDKAYFGFWGNDTGGGSHTLSVNEWTHLTWRFDNGDQALFVNGEFDNATGGHAALGSNATLEIGRSSGNQGWFDGRIDELAIFHRPLTDAEIAQLASGQALASVSDDLETAMVGQNASVYARIPFSLTSLSGLDSMTLRMQYNDGFVAYLNGHEILRRNAPATVAWNSTATATRTDEASIIRETFSLTTHVDKLKIGTNVLAIHGLNAGVSNETFLLNPVLTAGGLGTGSIGVFDDPTPGSVNAEIVSLGKVVDTTFSHDRGFYSAPIQVSIATGTAGASIRYTLDGSEPSPTAGTLYMGPVTIDETTPLRAIAYKSGFEDSGIDTQTYIFLDDVISQSTTPPDGWPTGTVNGQVLDYGMDAPGDIGTTGEELKQALQAIDTISIVTDSDNLFDSSTGIYVNAGSRGRGWERPASFELISKEGTGEVQKNAGLRIRGGFSRSGGNPKHALRLFFRNDYEGDLEYPMFGNEGVDRFENIDLRTSQNYSWAFQGDNKNTFLREVFARDAQRDMGRTHTRSRYYHVYLNGVYWGLYMTQERAEASYAETYFGGDSDDYDVVKSAGSSGGYQIEATDGNMTGWNAFWAKANEIAADTNATSRLAKYMELQGLNPDGTPNPAYPIYLDVENLIDYMLVILYVGSFDAPVSNFLGNERPNNWFSVWPRDGSMGFQFFAHDCEHSLGVQSGSTIDNRNGPWPAGSTQNYSNPQWIHQQLMAVEAYRRAFGDRAHALLTNGGLLSPEGALARVDERATQIETAIIAESARWGDAKSGTPKTKATWLSAVNSLRNHLNTRSAIVVDQLKQTRRYSDGNPSSATVSAPLYPSVAAPDFSQHGGMVDEGFGLRFSSEGGTVYYTLDGSDPRAANGSVSSAAEMAQSGSITSETLLGSNAGMKAFVPTNGALGDTWKEIAFNDSGWLSGTAGVGYDENTTYDSLINIDVIAAMNDQYTSVYSRSTFQVDDPQTYDGLTLRMKYDDGFVAYLNGVEIARANAPATVAWDSAATGLHDDAQAVIFVDFDVSPAVPHLVEGTNVLAIHALNDSINSSDLIILPELAGTRVTGGTEVSLTEGFSTVKARTLENGEWSALTEANFLVGVTEPTGENIVVSEIMYHPVDPTSAESMAGFVDADDFEYLEIWNRGGIPVDLGGAQFTDGLVFQFPADAASVLAPDDRLLIVRNLDAFHFRYGEGHLIAGVYEGGLSNGGEVITLNNAGGAVIFSFGYGDDGEWPASADGNGTSLILTGTDMNSVADWRASVFGGTPGEEDALIDIKPIHINEVLTHTDWPDVDAVELYNPNTSSVDVGLWYLTDDRLQPLKYRIPPGTTIPADGYLVFYEDDDDDPANNAGLSEDYFGSQFSLSSIGEEIYLYSADADGLTGFVDGFRFAGSENGVSFIRVVNSEDAVAYPPASESTLGFPNAAPKLPEVLISEIMYHPLAGGQEWVEIKNVSGGNVSLYDPLHPENTWAINGIGFSFPAGVVLLPDELALVTSGDPEAFRSAHGLDAGVQIFGPFSASLDNAGETLTLFRPDEPTLKNDIEVVPMIAVDSITYSPLSPWPDSSDGGGNSLERILTESYSNDPLSWQASEAPGGTPGYDETGSVERFVLTTSVSGQGSVLREPNFASYLSGSVVTLTPVPAVGWAFKEWNGAATGSAAPLQVTVSEDIAIGAVFEQRFTLNTSVAGAGSITVDPVQANYAAGAQVTLTAVPSADHAFTGWSGGATGTSNPVTVTMNQNRTVTATFQPLHPLTVEVNGNGTVTRDVQGSLYIEGSIVELTAVPDAGWAFAGWSGDVSGTSTTVDIVINEAAQVEATFVPLVSLQLVTSGEGGVLAEPDLAQYPAGSEVELTAVPEEGWAFVRWSDNGQENPRTVILEASTSLTAIFQRAFTLTVTAPTQGSIAVSPRGALYLEGTEVTLTANANAGFRFDHWTGDVSGDENPVMVTMNANKTVSAAFRSQGNLTALSEGSGSVQVSPQKETYDDGETVTLTALPEEGWEFVEWRGALTGTQNPAQLTIDGEQSVTAVFVEVFGVAVSASGEGSVARSPDQATYRKGTEVTLTATPAEGLRFVRWEQGGSGSENPLVFSVQEDTQVRAIFEEIVEEEGYAAWLTAHFTEAEKTNFDVSGPFADPDGDGRGNFIEYALGSDPRFVDVGAAPLEITGNTGMLFVSYHQPIGRDDVAYELQVSTEGEVWHASGEGQPAIVVEEIGRGPSTRITGDRVISRIDLGGFDQGMKVFVRLAVSRGD